MWTRWSIRKHQEGGKQDASLNNVSWVSVELMSCENLAECSRRTLYKLKHRGRWENWRAWTDLESKITCKYIPQIEAMSDTVFKRKVWDHFLYFLWQAKYFHAVVEGISTLFLGWRVTRWETQGCDVDTHKQTCQDLFLLGQMSAQSTLLNVLIPQHTKVSHLKEIFWSKKDIFYPPSPVNDSVLSFYTPIKLVNTNRNKV